jgi:hypothetical protein
MRSYRCTFLGPILDSRFVFWGSARPRIIDNKLSRWVDTVCRNQRCNVEKLDWMGFETDSTLPRGSLPGCCSLFWRLDYL